MPRKAKGTVSGAPGQAPNTPTGQTYGEGEAALESQRRAPMIDATSRVAPPGGGGGGPGRQPGQAAMGAEGGLPPEIAAALGMDPPTSALHEPTGRPDEPLMTGGAPHKAPLPHEGLYELRALAQRFPYPDLIRFLERVEREV